MERIRDILMRPLRSIRQDVALLLQLAPSAQMLSSTAAVAAAVCMVWGVSHYGELRLFAQTSAGNSIETGVVPVLPDNFSLTVASTTSATPATLATDTPAKEPLPTTPKSANEAVVSQAPVAAPAQTLPPAPLYTQQDVQDSLERVTPQTKNATVNIICLAGKGGPYRPISGSGVIIDPKGIVLTNAHIGQYFLLAAYPPSSGLSCAIRTGSPARTAYTARLIYLPGAWVRANPDTLTKDNPTGTGEHDYALLAITGSATGASLPSSFPYIPLATRTARLTEPVLIGSYAAQFLSTSEIQSALYPTFVYGSVQDMFTFATDTVDLISLGGSAAAQEGSSGGGVTDIDGRLLGLITTSTVTGQTSTRDLHAITTSYIRRDYDAQTHESLDTLLSKKPLEAINAFATEIPTLAQIILDTLTQ